MGRIDLAKMNAEAADVLKRLLGIDIDVTKTAGIPTQSPSNRWWPSHGRCISPLRRS